ncbi:DUF1102 domain-containing protein [Thermococcus radiotolerans]|uniref:DUF1102 domain-containing protein n=1 Tax=Thermococcus radiotolerans TaxID=187880 RepID=A0A2Z2N064_9EURY|nr:DUF1102 domain-containing protein [Thermococcus radiotolerans]ASJ15438.1 hypothetical protein A3L10_09970 [Thermococcus radiotolerans]
MRKILGLLALMIGLLVAVAASSAHFAYFEAERNVHIQIVPDDNELIDLTPLQPYAYITGKGMLVVELSKNNTEFKRLVKEGFDPGEGVSPNSTYVFEEVFGVSNDLWEQTPICMEISYSGDGGILFFEGDYVPGQTVGSDHLKVTIMPGDVARIGMILDSTNMNAGESITGQLHFYAVAGECK